MARYSLRLFEDRLGARAATPAPLPAANRVLYVKSGMARISANGISATLSDNSAWFGTDTTEIMASPDGAVILRYELVAPADPSTLYKKEDDFSSNLLLDAKCELDPETDYLMRCDRVDIPPGGIAYTHTHQGPGTRCLLEGGFTVETQGHKTEIAPGEPWFETGPDPVLAYAPPDSVGYFSRVMILPRNLKGKSSISYVKPEDADKPKLQRYTIFVDADITLPAL